MSASTSFRWMGALFYLAAVAGAWGQVATSSSAASAQPASANATTIQSFQQQQQALAQSLSALLAQHPTPQQLEAWQQLNAGVMAAQQSRAQALAGSVSAQAVSLPTEVTLPSNASPELANLVSAKLSLFSADVEQKGAAATTASASAVASAGASTGAANSESVTELSQALAAQTAHNPVPLPGASVIPPNASSNLQAYILLRDQLMRAEMQVYNQNVNSDPSVRDAAILQWRQANAAQFAQLQQLAQNLSSQN